MKCQKCDREAIIYQRYSGMHLCERHFLRDFEGRAKKAIRKHHWIQPNDTIAVAMSGGKDSSALLHFLVSEFSKRRDIRLMAISIDEGIEGYRDLSIPRRIADSMDVPWYGASFTGEYDISIDKIVEKTGDARSCSYCGVIRRHLLNKTARELGATKIALGFNLDDEAQSVLMNVLRGDVDRMARSHQPAERMIPRIRPFIGLPEREVALYAHLNVEGFEDRGCPYSYNALRADVRSLLNDYNYRHPATKYALVNLGEELAGRLGEEMEQPKMNTCVRCGEPFWEQCRTCQLLDEVRGND